MVFVIFSVVLYLSLSSRVSLSLSSVDDSLPPSPLVLSLSFPLFARTCVHFSIPKHCCFQVENWKFKEFSLSFNRESQTFVVSQLPSPAEVISVVIINNNKDQSIINVAHHNHWWVHCDTDSHYHATLLVPCCYHSVHRPLFTGSAKYPALISPLHPWVSKSESDSSQSS